MRKTVPSRLLACALVALGTACGGDDDGEGGGSVTSSCATICPKLQALDCPGDMGMNCITECEAQATQLPDCASQTRAWLACLATRPASDFECDATDNESGPKEGLCPTETSNLGDCILTTLPGGGGSAGTGGGTCDFTDDGECDEPDICPAGADTADCGGG